jgi:hypothetical protein
MQLRLADLLAIESGELGVSEWHVVNENEFQSILHAVSRHLHGGSASPEALANSLALAEWAGRKRGIFDTGAPFLYANLLLLLTLVRGAVSIVDQRTAMLVGLHNLRSWFPFVAGNRVRARVALVDSKKHEEYGLASYTLRIVLERDDSDELLTGDFEFTASSE